MNQIKPPSSPIVHWQLPITGNWQFYTATFVIAFSLLVSREPGRIFNAQFWAEDGSIFYADAYNLGFLKSLLAPYAGYLCIAQRIAASLVQPFSLTIAPTVLNCIALTIQVLPVILLLSSRFSLLIPGFANRLFLSFLYLGLPNSAEIHGNISNSQWYLALLAIMVILAKPHSFWGWRIFDLGIVLLSSLSGPFAILLIPIASLCWWRRRSRWLAGLIGGLMVGALAQGIAILLTAADARVSEPSVMTVEQIVKILVGQVFLGSLLGQAGYGRLFSPSLGYNLLVLVGAVLGAIALTFTLLKAPSELRLLVLYGGGLFVAALVSATVPWEHLMLPGAAVRYWYIPMVAFVTVLTWLARQKYQRWLRIPAIVLLAVMGTGIIGDWHHPPLKDLKFQEYVAAFEQAPSGTTFTIPINPTGWFMHLEKH